MPRIELMDGKYTVVNELESGGGFHALRYGEEWRSLAGDNLVLAMYEEIERLQAERDELYSISLWGARRAATKQYARYMYDEIETVVEAEVDRDWRGGKL
jgi:hypothetical protein